MKFHRSNPNDPESLRKRLRTLRKRLHKIIEEEKRACLTAGPTDVEAVYQRVKKRSSLLIEQLYKLLAEAMVRSMIQKSLKHTAAIKMEDAQDAVTAAMDEAEAEFDGIARQLEFASMEEFKGVPAAISYEDRPGHTSYVLYFESLEWQRAAAAKLLAKNLENCSKNYHALTASNDFASRLVALYGDLPLHTPITKWLADGRRDTGS